MTRSRGWLLGAVEGYLGWERLLSLAARWPSGSLIAPHRSYRFIVTGSSLAWLAEAQDAVRSRGLRRELAALRRDVRWGVWARYGFINGDLSSHCLDEPGRVQGSAINDRWRRMAPRLRREIPSVPDILRARRALCGALLAAGRGRRPARGRENSAIYLIG